MCMCVCVFVCVTRRGILTWAVYYEMRIRFGTISCRTRTASNPHLDRPHPHVSHYNTLQHTATHGNTLCNTLCNTLKHTATHGNTLQHMATHGNTRQHTATHGNTRQHTATHGNTRQHIATHGHTRPHTAKLCITPHGMTHSHDFVLNSFTRFRIELIHTISYRKGILTLSTATHLVHHISFPELSNFA